MKLCVQEPARPGEWIHPALFGYGVVSFDLAEEVLSAVETYLRDVLAAKTLQARLIAKLKTGAKVFKKTSFT